jgi:hypothetical protein
MSKKDEEQEGTRCEFVFDELTMSRIELIKKELKIGTRKDAVKEAINQLAFRIEPNTASHAVWREAKDPK